ncbi:MAG: hypothetical protein EPO20_17260 [Betaproteobacteria bacterium]|nr:MAG: hypothetical protein EPO20_17260 [Betaproteobacteria bacterium]
MTPRARSGGLLAGRLSAENGVGTLLEALALFTGARIASRVGSHVELIEPGGNGLPFEPGSARDLARRLAWAEAFPEKMRQMGECAQADYQARFVADWSWQRLYGERRKQARLHR